jgi:hypothetical protein
MSDNERHFTPTLLLGTTPHPRPFSPRSGEKGVVPGCERKPLSYLQQERGVG